MIPAGRVLIAKLGLDGHNVGARLIARVLRDSGFEVVFLGIRQTPEAVVAAASQEDVDVIGISILSGAHRVLVIRVLKLLQAAGDATPVVVGGVIPEEDRAPLLEAGVRNVIDASVPMHDVVRLFEALVEDRRVKSATP